VFERSRAFLGGSAGGGNGSFLRITSLASASMAAWTIRNSLSVLFDKSVLLLSSFGGSSIYCSKVPSLTAPFLPGPAPATTFFSGFLLEPSWNSHSTTKNLHELFHANNRLEMTGAATHTQTLRATLPRTLQPLRCQ
jgi:hypothetical protein